MSICIVCVFGISGVGKTTLIDGFVRSHPDWSAIRPGKMLATELGKDADSLRLEKTTEVLANQYLVADLLAQRRSQGMSARWLIDAHPFIDTKDGLVQIPVEILRKLEVTSLVLLVDDSAQILERRKIQSERKRPTRSIAELDAQQEYAKQVCESFASQLDVPLRILNMADPKQFRSAVLAEIHSK